MANDPNMAQGLNFAEDMKRLEEMRKQMEMSQAASQPEMNLDNLPDLKMPEMGATKADVKSMSMDPGSGDKTAMMNNYKDMLRQKIADSEGNLIDAKKAYGESQKAGSGWSGGAAKGLGIFADTMAGMAGSKGGYTKDVMGQFAKERKEGADKYKTAIDTEKGYLEEMDKMGKRELDDLTIAQKRESLDPKSQESEAARIFALKEYGIKLPDNTNAIQAKVYMDMHAKKAGIASTEKWKQRNYDQRERELKGPTPKELEKRKYEEQNKPPTEGQATSAIHTRAMLEGEESAKSQLKQGYDPTEWTSQIGETLQKTPFIGAIARQFRSKEGVAYTDAKDGWIGAKLRKESGAAIAADEYLKENRKYFPQSGDSPEASMRKEKARKALTQQMAKNAGRALTPDQVAQVDKIYGIPDVVIPKMDSDALDWLQANPDHPDAPAVAEKLGLSDYNK